MERSRLTVPSLTDHLLIFPSDIVGDKAGIVKLEAAAALAHDRKAVHRHVSIVNPLSEGSETNLSLRSHWAALSEQRFERALYKWRLGTPLLFLEFPSGL